MFTAKEFTEFLLKRNSAEQKMYVNKIENNNNKKGEKKQKK